MRETARQYEAAMLLQHDTLPPAVRDEIARRYAEEAVARPRAGRATDRPTAAKAA